MCVNDVLSSPSTRCSLSCVISRTSSSCIGRGSRCTPEECLVSDFLSSVRSSRSTFCATSASVYSGIVSRNTSASPSAMSRSTSTTELVSSAARAQARLTAMLDVPTPPVAPATAKIWQLSLLRRRRRPTPAARTRCSAALRSSGRSGSVRNSLAPARIDSRISRPSVELLDTRIEQLGRLLQRLADELDRPRRIAVHRDEADVGLRLLDDVDEERVPRALGFEPDRLQPKQHRFEALPGRVVRVDDRNAKYVGHAMRIEGCRLSAIGCRPDGTSRVAHRLAEADSRQPTAVACIALNVPYFCTS